MYQELQTLIGLFGLFGLIIVALFMGMHLIDRRLHKEARVAAEQVAKQIITENNWPGKQHWIDGDKMETITVIFGPIPGERRVWARVRCSAQGTTVTIEHWFTATALDLSFARQVTKYLERRSYPVSFLSALRQPDRSELLPEEVPLVDDPELG